MKNKILNRVIATIGVAAVLFGSLTGCLDKTIPTMANLNEKSNEKEE